MKTVTKIEFLIDGVSVGEDSTSPYAIPWRATVGNHTLIARSHFDDGTTQDSPARNFSVNEEVPTDPPNHVEDSYAYYKMEDTANGLVDEQGNLNGTLHGNIAVEPGVKGNGFRFGGNAEARLGDYDLEAEFSIAAWVKPTGTAVNQWLFAKYAGANPPLYCRWNGSTGTGLNTIANSNVEYSLTMNEWNHLVITFANRENKVYVNGAFVGESSSTVTPNPNDADLTIGSRGGQYYFQGAMDEVRIFDREITAEEVQELFNL